MQNLENIKIKSHYQMTFVTFLGKAKPPSLVDTRPPQPLNG